MTTDEPDAKLDPLAPADEARIRALLSDARETDPMPPQIATRLDDAIAGLAADRAHALDSGYEPNMRPLVRTRRHRVVAVLGAAAAVAVLGLAIGTFFDSDDQSARDATSAETAVDRGDNAAENATEDSRESLRTDPTAPGSGDNASPELTRTAVPAAIRSRHLGRDLAALRDRVLPDPPSVDYSSGTSYVPEGFACVISPADSAVFFAVRYDGAPAYVAFQEPMGDAQVVDVLQCGTGDVLRTTTLPVPD